MKKTLLASVLILCTAASLVAQDVIYTANGGHLENAQLTGVSDGKITFSMQGKTVTFQRQSILLAFRSNGNFLVVSELGDDLPKAEQRLQAYLSAPPLAARDYLIKAVPLTVIPATISYENQTIVNYATPEGKSASIPKGELLGILYRDGHHTLFREASEVAPLLIEVRNKLTKERSDGKSQATVVTVTQSVSVHTAPVPVNPPSAQPPTDTKPLEQNSAGSPPAVTDATDARTFSLSETDYQLYRKRALQKVDEFVGYLNIITNKSLPTTEKDDAITEAAKLFMPAATIEVTSKNRPGARRFPIKEYLTRLKLLPYSSAKIEWTNIQYIKEMSQAADGNYYGVIAGEQTFMGYGSQGNNVIYSDVTPKRVRVKLERYHVLIDGADVAKWNLLLGSIGVSAN
ncbi:hypothetical protein [Spirosoma sp. 48-14]|uniref:hypothetical protein n=1 Tax=Spirosoma sp. 48-14 TaxID=1895854 RepID=UPI0009617B6A|nr:hypothetical protein [Spirosoma sp. 48-14]OJW74266.1 MAG: hypothetical protein BGO59_14220 [Spirosoma sp. 48-14]